MLALLLTASMLMLSDRNNFWENNSLSPKTQFAEVNEIGITRLIEEEEIAHLQGRRVLLLIHGFATSEVCYPYFNIQANILGSRSPYDAVIGYLWPSRGNPFSYLEAKKNADRTAPRLRAILRRLQSLAVRVDVVAHSLGNRVVMQALRVKDKESILIDNFLLIGPAIDARSIHKHGEFYESTSHCNQLFVFYSERDNVLKWIYPIPEWNKALGYGGNHNYKKFPQNIQMIDCTQIVDSHNAYLFSKPLFSYVQQAVDNLLPGPNQVLHVAFTMSGMFEILRWRDMWNF